MRVHESRKKKKREKKKSPEASVHHIMIACLSSMFQLAASLLGIDPATLKTNLISKNIGNRSTLMVAYSVPKAAEARDALVKFLYGNLFQSIIDQINLSLATSQTSADHTNIIGVLFFDHPVSLCFFVVVVVVE